MLLFFEHAITLDREIGLFWRNRASVSTILFLANRYIMLATSVLTLVQLFDTNVGEAVSPDVDGVVFG